MRCKTCGVLEAWHPEILDDCQGCWLGVGPTDFPDMYPDMWGDRLDEALSMTEKQRQEALAEMYPNGYEEN